MNQIENLESEIKALEIKLKAAKDPIDRSFIMGGLYAMQGELLKLLKK